jgi:hypothetical protein
MISIRSRAVAFIFVATLAVAAPSFADDAVAALTGGGASLDWLVNVSGHESIQLTVLFPNGDSITKQFPAGKTPMIRLSDLGADAPDGVYNYQMRVTPKITPDLRAKLIKARASNDDAAARKAIREAGIVAPEQSGAFTILNGSFVTPGQLESRNNATTTRGVSSNATTVRPRNLTPAVEDNVIADDLIVQGSACVGLDCVNNESFGFDTIRLKENNTQINFDDTSTSAGFPANDWTIVANDSASGGNNYLAFNDVTNSRKPFTVEGGAPANTLYADSLGYIGIQNGAPQLQLHMTKTDTPAIRMEQTNAGGFTAQTWDIGGNEANWFVRDLTGGSLLPFRIRPGAPTSSVDISASGNVGFGTASPSRKIHAITTNATDNVVLEIQNNAAARMRFTNSANSETWNLGHQSPSGTGIVLSDAGDGVTEMILDVAGNMTISGTLTQGSSRTIKKDFTSVDPATALEGVQKLPISTWVYKDDPNAARHIGPMAEEFHAAFGVGVDDKHIAPSDQAGLALAAIQGLANMVQQRDQRIEQLESRLSQLEQQLTQNSNTPKQ